MKNKIFNTVTIFLLLVTLINCNSEESNEFTPTLPEATQIGANTFGCYVDGKLLIPRDGTGTIFGPDKGMSFIGSGPPEYAYNEIVVRDYKSGTSGIIKIHIDNLNANGQGDYIVNESNCQDGIDAFDNINITLRWLDEELQIEKWYCSTINSGDLIITRFEINNRIVSGTFSCTAKNRNNPNETIEITEGRFDLKWNLLPSTEFP